MTPSTDVLCAGIIVADHVSSPISHLPAAGELVLADQLLLTIGGCAANVAVDLVKLGATAAVVGRVGGDVFGRVVADMLRERRVDVSALQTTPGVDTSQTLIVNVAGQDRRFIHTFGANAAFRAADVPAERAARCRVLYLGGYLLMGGVRPDELRAVFAAARRAGARTVLDVVTPGPGDYLPRLEALLPEVDVFLPNHHEAELITGQTDPLAQAETFHRLGAKTAIVTLGDGGSVLVDGREAAADGDVPGAVRGRHAAAATPSRPATSTDCCAAWTRRAACVGPARSAPAASGPSARPQVCLRERSAMLSWPTRCCG